MNFKSNIERCQTAQKMGYRVQYLSRFSLDWHNEDVLGYDYPDSHYRVHPDDVEAFEADLAAREDAARKQSEPPLADHTDNIAACKEAQAMGFRVQLLDRCPDEWTSAGCPWSFDEPPHHYRVHPDDMEAYLKMREARRALNAGANTTPAPDTTEGTTTVDATSVETPDDSLEVLAKLLPLLGSLPGVTADITITLHIKV